MSTSRVLTIIGLTVALAALLAPAHAGVSVMGGLTREATVTAGQRIEGSIEVRNGGPTPQQARAYQTDYQFCADGTSSYGEPGQAARSNAAWITLAPHQLTIPAGGAATFYYVIQVPDDAELVGTHWSMIMVEGVPDGSLEPAAVEAGLSLRTVLRFGVQMVTHFGDTGDSSLKFLERQLIVDGDRRVLCVDLENTGQRSLSPTVWAEMCGVGGDLATRCQSQRKRIYPGCSARFEIDLTDVAPGVYRALVVADNGDEHVFGARYDLDLP